MKTYKPPPRVRSERLDPESVRAPPAIVLALIATDDRFPANQYSSDLLHGRAPLSGSDKAGLAKGTYWYADLRRRVFEVAEAHGVVRVFVKPKGRTVWHHKQ